MGRNAIITIFYYLNIFYEGKPRYFYIFWKVVKNVIFESWEHLKSISRLFIKNHWSEKSYWLAKITVIVLQFRLHWFQRHWVHIFKYYLTKFISWFLVQYNGLGGFYKIGTEWIQTKKNKPKFKLSGRAGTACWAGPVPGPPGAGCYRGSAAKRYGWMWATGLDHDQRLSVVVYACTVAGAS